MKKKSPVLEGIMPLNLGGPLFDYTSHIKTVSNDKLQEAINIWFKTSKNLHLEVIGACPSSDLEVKFFKALCEGNDLDSLALSYYFRGSGKGGVLVNAFAKSSTLTSLYFFDNAIGKNALSKILYKNTTLTSLNLRDRSLDPEGEGGKALARERHVNLLDIPDNQIGDEGGKAFTEALIQNKTLTSLNLSYNQLDSEGGKAFTNALNKISL
ncbi:RNI-like protein [Gigaspora margarita]|uniref:RNI-like protein n=1 Tax=Gigaspora margarita TaxID=4874 RepID=A0A8H4EI90_GIGMA|nr:RNI-like protein [Gigaspora margarita]